MTIVTGSIANNTGLGQEQVEFYRREGLLLTIQAQDTPEQTLVHTLKALGFLRIAKPVSS